MSIYQTPADDLALLLSTVTGTTVLSTHFTVVGIMSTPTGESTYNTKIRIKFGSPSFLTGEKTFYYDRLNLADLANLHPFTNGRLKSQAGDGIAVSSLFPALRDGLGINFTTADLVETIAASDDDGANVLLQAKPTSLGWYGQYQAKLSPYTNYAVLLFSFDLTGY